MPFVLFADRRAGRLLACLALLYLCGSPPLAAQTFSIGSTSIRPFVVAVVPVVGRNGSVGGVSINAAGVVRRAERGETASLRKAWLRAAGPISPEMARSARLRMVSLRDLHEALARHVSEETPLPDELFFLAGLQRVEYVLVVPSRNDVVLAGPAEGWRLDKEGAMVGVTTGTATLRLDDLLDAFRAAEAAAAGKEITCSIDPSEEGLARLQRLLRGRPQVNQWLIERMREAVGEQEVSVSGVGSDSHFARVMVAADYMMKGLAMGLEEAPVEDMSSYLELLSESSRTGSEIAAPRWWMAANYETLLRSPDRLAWQLRGPAVKAMTEDGYLNATARIASTGRDDPLAQQWADLFTEQYGRLSDRLPVFSQLRNCIDLAVVAALIVDEDLLGRAGCELPLFFDESKVRGPRYNVPRTVESQWSLTRGRRGWFVSISGGVSIDCWQVLNRVEISDKLPAVRSRARVRDAAQWWWE